MSDIIEIMKGEFRAGWCGNGAVISSFSSWTVNNAVPEIELDTTGAEWAYVFRNGGGAWRLQPRDNALILSAWLVLPYCFGLSRPGATMFFRRGCDGWGQSLPEMGPPAGAIYMPVAGAEVSLGVFCPWERANIGGTLTDLTAIGVSVFGWVSQIGAPAALNGVVLRPTPFIKVRHTLALT